MTTVRQIERHWNAKDYGRLFRELTSHRLEAGARMETEIRAAHAAAMAVIRMDELAQSHVPLMGKLVRSLLLSQETDGGWGDPLTTAICLRALLCGQGNGLAVQRGMDYLAKLQQDDGIWPGLPLRRLPGDAHVSAFILSQLADHADFRDAVRLGDAVGWFERHAIGLDEQTLALWERAKLRGRLHLRPAARALLANVA